MNPESPQTTMAESELSDLRKIIQDLQDEKEKLKEKVTLLEAENERYRSIIQLSPYRGTDPT